MTCQYDGEPEPIPVIRPSTAPPSDSEGVDVTLIRWMLSMTPLERLLTLQNTVRSLLRLRDAVRRS